MQNCLAVDLTMNKLYGIASSNTTSRHHLCIMAFRDGSICAASLVGFVVYFVTIPVDDSGLKKKPKKQKRAFHIIRRDIDKCARICSFLVLSSF